MNPNIIQLLQSERSRIDQAIAILNGNGANGVPILRGCEEEVSSRGKGHATTTARGPNRKKPTRAARSAAENLPPVATAEAEAPQTPSGRLRLIVASKTGAFDQNDCAEWLGADADVGKIKGCLAYWAKTDMLEVVEAGRPGHPAKYKRTAEFRATA